MERNITRFTPDLIKYSVQVKSRSCCLKAEQWAQGPGAAWENTSSIVNVNGPTLQPQTSSDQLS